MPQEYGHLANLVEEAQDFICLVCGANPTEWTWGDVHGEAMCTMCGTPYQLLQYANDGNGNRKRLHLPPKLNIKKSWLPVFRQYWEEKHKFIGAARLMIERDYPECIEGMVAFHDWLNKHEELVPSD